MNWNKSSFSCIILSLLFMVNGCKTSVSPTITAPPPEAGSMKATVNGQAWASTATDSAYAYGGATAILNKPLIGALTITGISIGSGTTPMQTITISLIQPHLGVDSMSLSTSYDPNTASFLYGTNHNDIYVTIPTMPNVGLIDITKYDTANKLISGTFSFTATQQDTMSHTIQVTNGSFYDVSWR